MYVHCTPEQEGVYEGVEWLQWQRFRAVRCDVLIASRTPWAVRDAVNVGGVHIGGCKYTAAVLWVHDIHVGQFADVELRRFDRILCLSKWHAGFFVSHYEQHNLHIDPAKVKVTRNGIDLSRFEGTEGRNPHRAIYSSSPDRGLLAAVLAWPKIRERVPDAELHCFYGFSNWEKSAADDPGQQQIIARLKHLCATTPGVVMRGRVSQKELAREFMRAGVWCYPTWFSETSCISAMEAQAAGCAIVTCPIAALAETVGDRGDMLSEKWGDNLALPRPEFVTETADAVIAAMGTEQYYPVRQAFGLDTLADEWSETLLELEAELALNPVPGFKGEAAE
jgi:glycosyltransferase involved in cell wall biosynthesis